MTGSEVTARGYSVFDGTMADMTYVQIEEAAKERIDILLEQLWTFKSMENGGELSKLLTKGKGRL